VAPEQAGTRLDEMLAGALSTSKSQARKLIVVGAVRVNGRTVRPPGRALPARASVEARVRPEALRRVADRAFEITSAAVLFEDETLIAIDKPPYLPTPPTIDPSRPSLVGALRQYLGANAYLGIHQRLDRDTSGVIVFAKHPRANPGLARAFAERSVVKLYAALTAAGGDGHPDEWLAKSRLSRGEGKPPRVRVVEQGGLEAETRFRISERLARAWLVEARPLTGRKHQIRVQLAAERLPILGDEIYGGAREIGGLRVPRTLLHAASLALPHPLTGVPLKIESPLPADFASAISALS
jgi:RluA family pseudouridine synthase